MSEPQVRVECVNVAPCSKCGEERVCVSVVSTTVVREQYDAPLFGLDLCRLCLLAMAHQIENGVTRTVQRRLPETPDVDEEGMAQLRAESGYCGMQLGEGVCLERPGHEGGCRH